MFDLTKKRWPIPDEERVNSLALTIYNSRNDLDYNLWMALEDAYEISSASDAIDQGIETEIKFHSRNGRFDIILRPNEDDKQTDTGGDAREEYTP
ncbi:MAG TPA: hypothetical protein VII94_02490 [Candidatus Saccharimonadales bacterium]